MRQMRKRMIIAVLVTMILTLAVAGAIGYFIISNQNKTIDELNSLAASSKALAFSKEIKANSIITPSDITEIAVKDTSYAAGGYYKSEGSSGFVHYIITKDDVGNNIENKISMKKEDLYGRVVKGNVSKNTPILDSLLYAPNEETSADERIQEFNFIYIPSDLVENDYIDVRIQFPTGEDYLVLVGKKIEKYSGNTTIFMKLTEDEIMTMGSAIIEAYMQKGVRLYANKYTDPATQLYKEEIVDLVKKYDDGINEAKTYLKNLEARKIAASLVNGQQTYGASGNVEAISTLRTEVIDGELVVTKDSYAQLPEEQRMEIESKIKDADESSITDEDISRATGIKLDHVIAIKEAEKIKDEKTLAYYKTFRLETRTPLISTYPVKSEVLQVVKTNPNILETIKAEFDKKATVSERYDKYVELEKQLQTAPEVSYDGSAKTKSDIRKEMDQIVEDRTGNIQTNINKAYDEQKARRIAYLESLVKKSK